MTRNDLGSNPGAFFRRKASSWHPVARIAVMLMLGVLGGADIWIFTMAEISALPQLHVNLNPARPNPLLEQRTKRGQDAIALVSFVPLV